MENTQEVKKKTKDFPFLTQDKAPVVPHPLVWAAVKETLPRIDFAEVAKAGGKSPDKDGNIKLDDSDKRIIAAKEYIKAFNRTGYQIASWEDSIWIFNGTHWERQGDLDVKKHLGEAISVIGGGWSLGKVLAYDFSEKIKMLQQVKAECHLVRGERSGVVLNFLNCTLHIVPGSRGAVAIEERPHDPSDLCEYVLPYNYESGAECPMFDKYLNEVLPDVALQNALAEFIASSFVPRSVLKLERALMLIGTGANGKSTFHDIVLGLLSDKCVSSVPLSSLTTNPNSRAMLAGKFLNYSSESFGKKKRSEFDPEVFKQLCSREPIIVKHLYRDELPIYDYGKLIFNCNDYPDISMDSAIGRRFLVVPFDVTIPKAKRDLQLAEKIKAKELPGVMCWVLAGLSRLLKQGDYTDSIRSREELDKFRKDKDTVFKFVSDSGMKEAPKLVRGEDVYREYSAYCASMNIPHGDQLGSTSFYRRLEALGFKPDKIGRAKAFGVVLETTYTGRAGQ